MSSAAAKETLVVTATELIELAEWERKYADAKKKASAAEKELNFRRQSLAEKVLGVNSSDELKKLNPAQVERLQEKRHEHGDWKAERGAPAFRFVKANEGRYPSWSQLFVAEFGEVAAHKIRAETPITYSYAVSVEVE
jgi:hypothetical protein